MSERQLIRLRDTFLEQVRDMFERYLIEAPEESDNFIGGQDITFAQAVQFVNDVLLYGKDGEELLPSQTVRDPTVPRS